MAKKESGSFSSEEMKRYFTDPEYRRSKQKQRLHRKTILWSVAAVCALLLVAFCIWYVSYIRAGLPSLEKLENPKPELATKVFSADGEVLDQFFIKNRSRVIIDSLPPNLVKGLIATEDKAFYDHWGVHFTRIVKAMVKNIIRLDLTGEGASTLTQQLAKNLYLTPDRNVFDKITRKFREVWTSIQLERNFTKKEILELYLNVSYFGRGAYGIESAAERFFGKTASQLELPEYTLLIGILNGPGYYDPINNPDRARNRRAIVLMQMVKDGIISQGEASAANAAPLTIRASQDEFRTGIAPHYVESIRRMLVRKGEQFGFDIYRDGLSVYTTLDSRIQRHAIEAIEEHLAEFQAVFNAEWNWDANPQILKENIEKSIRDTDAYKNAPTPEAKDSIAAVFRSSPAFVDSVKKVAQTIEVGLVVINPHNGYIQAMVGGSNFRLTRYGLNHVTQIRRQPGSAFKTFVYTAAIDNGYPPCYEILNQPIVVPQPDGSRWAPENIDKSIGGKYTIREAIKRSINLIAVRAIMDIAPAEEVVQYAKRMGITTKLLPYPSLALGTYEVTPLEITTAYGVLANEGILVEPLSVIRVEDKDGNLIEENVPQRQEVLSKETAFLMTDMLQDVVNGGTGGRVRQFFNYPAAGKTGTTQDYGDAWYLGYTPQLVAGIWIGFDDNRIKFTSSDGQGGRAAAPIWGRLMAKVYDDPRIPIEIAYFPRPGGIVEDTICVDTKKKATEYCPNKSTEFINARYPLSPCDLHTSPDWNLVPQGRSKIQW